MTEKGSGAPVKENPISQDVHKEMLSYYYKKQEEQKKLESNDEDDYLNSPWADPDRLKRELHGATNLTWKQK